MEEKRLLSLVRKALDQYSMINENETVAIGISGGKDSLTLLYALAKLKNFYPEKFDVLAVTVDLGWKDFDTSKIKEFCDRLNVEYHVVKTDIYNIIFNERKEENPCSLCAKMRKGAMNTYLVERGIKKIAYAHHMDDVVETMMMSLIYEGRLNTFSPVTYLEDSDISVIRPLINVTESEVKGFVNKYDLPVMKSSCPVDRLTKRESVKELVNSINRNNPGAKKRMYTAVKNSYLEGWNKNA